MTFDVPESSSPNGALPLSELAKFELRTRRRRGGAAAPHALQRSSRTFREPIDRGVRNRFRFAIMRYLDIEVGSLTSCAHLSRERTGCGPGSRTYAARWILHLAIQFCPTLLLLHFRGNSTEQPVQLIVPIATSKQSQALQQLQLQYVIIFRFHRVRNQRHLVVLRSSISIATLTRLTSKYPSPQSCCETLHSN